MKVHSYLQQGLLIAVILGAVACNNNQTAKDADTKPAPDSSKIQEPEIAAKKGPVINITDTLSVKRLVLVMKDSAATIERVSMKLGEIFQSKLVPFIKKSNVKATGAPIAWYKGQKAPYFFEAGIPVDKKPAKLVPGISVKQIGVDSVVVAHFYGPYDLLPQAYDALKDWMKDRKKVSKAAPYEIYIGDAIDSTGKANDPYKVQTDVVWPWK